MITATLYGAPIPGAQHPEDRSEELMNLYAVVSSGDPACIPLLDSLVAKRKELRELRARLVSLIGTWQLAMSIGKDDPNDPVNKALTVYNNMLEKLLNGGKDEEDKESIG